MRFKWSLGAAALLASLAVGPAAAEATSCRDVSNPYPGTRYEGVDLTHIRAQGVKCPKARRVAKRAHKKGLAIGVPPLIRRYTWNGWSVVGDLRPDHDRYRATRRDREVRWRF